jgi:hypothetical protein
MTTLVLGWNIYLVLEVTLPYRGLGYFKLLEVAVWLKRAKSPQQCGEMSLLSNHAIQPISRSSA